MAHRQSKIHKRFGWGGGVTTHRKTAARGRAKQTGRGFPKGKIRKGSRSKRKLR